MKLTEVEEFRSRLRAAGLKNVMYDDSTIRVLITMFKAADQQVREKCARKCEILLTGAKPGNSEYLRGHDDALTTAANEIRKGKLV